MPLLLVAQNIGLRFGNNDEEFVNIAGKHFSGHAEAARLSHLKWCSQGWIPRYGGEDLRDTMMCKFRCNRISRLNGQGLEMSMQL